MAIFKTIIEENKQLLYNYINYEKIAIEDRNGD